MPVVNRDVERQIVERAQQRGMNPDQIKQAILQYRNQNGGVAQPSVQAQPSAPQAVPAPEEKRPNILQQIAKPFARVGASVGALVSGIGDLAKGDVAGANEALTRERNVAGVNVRPVGIPEKQENIAFQPGAGNALKDVGRFAADVIGTGAEIGSYAAPASLLTKGGSLGARVLGGAAAGAVGGSLGSFGQSLGEDKKPGQVLGSTLTGGLLGAGIGGALPGVGAVAGKVLKPIGNTLGRAVGEVLGKATGAGEGALREAYNSPAVIKFARRAGAEGPESLMTEALDGARRGLGQLKKVRGNEYLTELEKIKLNKSQLDDVIGGARARARELAAEQGIKFTEGKLLNNLDFADSTIERGQGTVQKALNDVMRWRDVTPAGLDKLQKKLSQHLDEFPVTEHGGGFNFVLELKNSVSDALKAKVPGYEAMTRKYHEASDLITEIQRALSLKDTVAKDTAVRKLMSSMRQNNELRAQLISVLGKASGENITGKLAGATLGSWTPRGLAGSIASPLGSVGAMNAVIHPSTIPLLLVYLASSSPRLMAEALTLLGRVPKGAKIIPLPIQKALRNLLIRAANEQPEEAASPQQQPVNQIQ